MTWAELALEIDNLTEEQKNTDVTVFVPGLDEFYATKSRVFVASEDDVLDTNHPYLIL